MSATDSTSSSSPTLTSSNANNKVPPPLLPRESSFRRLQRKLPSTPKGLKRFLWFGVFLFVLGIILLIIAAVTTPELSSAVSSGLRNAVILNGPNANGYANWQDNEKNPLVMELFIFDVANPLEILNGADAILIERGPYVYHERRVNFNESWSDNGGILNYRQYSSYTFIPELSVESDEARLVTSLNVPFQALRYSLSASSMGLLPEAYEVLTSHTQEQILFTTRSVRELIFGYQDPVLAVLKNFEPSLNDVFPGWMKNYTIDYAYENVGLNTIITGEDDMAHIRWYERWNNMSSLTVTPACTSTSCPTYPLWDSAEANAVAGNDGTQFDPPVTSSSSLTVFFSSYYRPIQLQYAQDITFKGINLLAFRFPASTFANSSDYPFNGNFYQFGTPYGLINISKVVQNVPTFLSNPRFMNADPVITQHLVIAPLDSFTPTVTEFDVEPYSGAAFRATASNQINIFVTPLPNMAIPGTSNTTTWFANLQPVYFPVFWAQETGSITDADASTFVNSVYGAIFLEDISQNLGYPFGGVFVVVGALIIVYVSFVNKWICSKCHDSEAEGAKRNLLYDGGEGSPSLRPSNSYHHSSRVAKDDIDISVA